MKTIKVKEIQTSPVIKLFENDMLSTAVKIILTKRIHNIVIINKDKSFSILSIADILNSVSQKEWSNTPISSLPKKALKLIDGENNTIAASMMMEENDEIFGVVNTNEELTGVVSYQDITDATELSAEELSAISLNAIVLRNSASTAEYTDQLNKILPDLNTSPTACLIVLKEQKPCGIITQRDIVRLLDAGKSLNEPLEKCMTSPLFSVTGDISVTMALHLMQKHHYRRILVLNDKGFLIGVVAQKEIVRILYNYAAKKTWHSYAGLNEILTKEVEIRTQELQKHQEELEYQVNQRTMELLEANLLLAEAKQAADEANSAKSIFLANMSHEIRTPINAIFGYLELLSNTSMDQEQTRYVNKSANAANTLISLISEVLDFSKIEAGKLSLASVPFNPNDLLVHSLELFEIEARQKNLLLEYEIDKNLPNYLQGDPERIRQIIINLVGNAIKFTEYGSIHISLFMHYCTSKKCSVEFVVSDTGIGIPKEKQSSLFDLFTQVDNTARRKQGGTGLGLSICKHLVQAMKGTIEVESNLGEGSTFSFTLILDLPDVPMLQQKYEEQDFEFTALDILLVEDNDDNREVALRSMTAMGVNVDEAINGKQALEMIRAKPYDLVLMDIQMPVMDGLSATRVLRDEGFSELPIIAISAHATVEEYQNSIAAGMNFHLNKPFKAKDLKNILLQYFPDKAIKKTVVSSLCTSCWVNELPVMPGIVLQDDVCDYWLNKEDFLQRVQPFIRHIVTESEHFHTLMDEKSIPVALQLLHKLKGSVKLYGAKRLFQSIEELASALDTEEHPHILDIRREFDAAVEELSGDSS